MQPYTRAILLFGLVFATFALPAGAAAQERGMQSITCESNNGRRNYCGMYRSNQVSLQSQISGTRCIRDQTWGVDNQGLWVDRGCRAVFSVRGPGTGPGGPGPGFPGSPGAGLPVGGGPVWTHPGPGDRWPPSGNWNGGNWGRGGACFYREYGFQGDYFCMRRGESYPTLGSYGGNISSLRVFGGARVTVFNDSNFRSDQDTTNRDFADLRQWRMSARPSHTWNNRMSSVQVR